MRMGSTMWRRSPMTCVKSATTSQVETIYQYLNASYISCLDHSFFDVNHFLIKINLRCRGSFHSGGGHQGGDRARHQPDDVSVHGITSLHYCQDDTNSVTPVKLALYFIYMRSLSLIFLHFVLYIKQIQIHAVVILVYLSKYLVGRIKRYFPDKRTF